jgi:archaellum biogenesis ATPase FlaH
MALHVCLPWWEKKSDALPKAQNEKAMSSWESRLISRIIRNGELKNVAKYGITPDDFLLNENRALFNYIKAYSDNVETRNSVLGVSAITQLFPAFPLDDDPSMTTESLCYEVKKNRVSTEFGQLLKEADDLRQVDPVKAMGHFDARVNDLRRVLSGGALDVNVADGVKDSIHRYELRRQGYTTSVAYFPWDYVNQFTGGIQDDDFIIVFGRPKQKKSWMVSALCVALQEQNKRVLVYTREAPKEQFCDRLLCAHARVDYSAYKAGKLLDADYYNMYAAGNWLHDMQSRSRMMLLDASSAAVGTDTIGWLHAKIEEYEPDITIVDGLYLMSDQDSFGKKGHVEDHVRVRNISRAARRMILDTKKPVIATIQANRGASKTASADSAFIAFSDALAQDATHFWRVISENKSQTIAVMVGGARESMLGHFRVNGQCARDFSFISPIDDETDVEGFSEEKKKRGRQSKDPVVTGTLQKLT